jgi:uroporphyrinogen-III synthase
MRLIVTRPEEDAKPLKVKLEGRGHAVTLFPLLKIIPRANLAIPQGPFQAVCATSANSLRSIDDASGLHLIPIFTVGAQSLAAAKQAGFVHASAHGGDVHGLAAHLKAHLKPQDGPILYLAGAEVSGDLKGALEAAGFNVTKLVTYDAVPQKPAALNAMLAAHDGVLLYSPRTAKIFADAAVEDAARGLIFVCLSPNVAAQLPAHWEKRVAAAPDEDSLLALLD